MYKISAKRVVFCSMILIFVLILSLLLFEMIEPFDMVVYNYIHKLENPYVTYFFKVMSFLCSTLFISVLCIIFFIFFKKKKVALFIFLNILICYILNVLLKSLIARDRPLVLSIINETGYSFPSGHSMGSMAFYGFLLYLLLQYPFSRKIKIVMGILFSFLILLIGVSRIYLGVHYASDVIAGFALSLAYLLVFITFIKPKLKR